MNNFMIELFPLLKYPLRMYIDENSNYFEI